MPNMISIKLEGLAAFKAGLNQYKKLIEKDVEDSLKDAVRMIGMVAKANAKVQSIGQTIRSGKASDGNGYEVTTDGVVSVYLEFGTGNYAKTLLGNYPKDWKDMAMKFYINGLGRSPAMPYLYPAYRQYAGEAVLDIVNRIEKR